MKFKLCSWEENGYHDSDGYTAYWDDETQSVGKVLTWTTRGIIDGTNLPKLEMPTVEVVHDACEWLANWLFDALKKAEMADVFCPNAVSKGERVRLVRDCRHKGRKYAKNSAGEVVATKAFGSFYHNGYNRPGRENTRVLVWIDGGDKAWFALSALRLDRDPLSDADLRYNAESLSANCQFHKTTGWTGWTSDNWALAVLKAESEVAA